MNLVHLTLTLAELRGRFHIRLRFDEGGMWFDSEESFPTQSEAEKVMVQFATENGIQLVHAAGRA